MKPTNPMRKPIGAQQVREAVLHVGDLSCLLPVIRGAITKLGDPRSTSTELQRILAADPAISARILRLANSAYFGVSRDVSTLSSAVTLIGFKRLEMMLRHILVSELLDILSVRRKDEIWQTSIASGTLCFEISRRCWVGDPEEMLLMGLLHNVGRLALRSLFPTQYSIVVEMGESNPREAEREVFGTDGGQVGAWLLDAWRFPVIFTACCESWLEPLNPEIRPCFRQRLCVVHAAAQLASSSVCGIELPDAFQSISPSALELLDLTPLSIHSLYTELPGRMLSLQETLGLA